ncbi:DUF4013 domain-containing protein [Halorussus halophilus]|uniref:DUF4013 domain-containing protein n=1 Tax=Halorussus halophilus TaxID=2650975 RepID=UPI0013012B4B|nr:DUF4013 domain-containing protein [Halorussus halophilus]
MFEDALTYLKDSDDAVETVLIGGILSLLGFLLIPVVFVAGYFQRVLRRTSEGDPAPSFDDWEDLFVEGLKAIVVGFAYVLIPAILAVLLVGSTVLFTVSTAEVVSDPMTTAPTATDGIGFLGLLALLGAVFVTFAAAIAAWYVVPAALARLAVEGRLGAAFELSKLVPVLRSGSYATGWLVAFVVLVVGGALVSGLASIPFFGWALVPFVAFYVNVVAYALYGRAYGDATHTERREGTLDEEQRPAV